VPGLAFADFMLVNPPESMSDHREFTSTSVSIPTTLLKQARAKAASTYRNFSQYVSYLVDQDLNRTKPKRGLTALSSATEEGSLRDTSD
jgi:hypothetical protein